MRWSKDSTSTFITSYDGDVTPECHIGGGRERKRIYLGVNCWLLGNNWLVKSIAHWQPSNQVDCILVVICQAEYSLAVIHRVDCNQRSWQAMQVLMSSHYVDCLSTWRHVAFMSWLGRVTFDQRSHRGYIWTPLPLHPRSSGFLVVEHNYWHSKTKVIRRAHIVVLCLEVILYYTNIDLHMSYIHTFSIPYMTPQSIAVAFIY